MTPILTMERISKSFPGVRALCEVDLELHAGEVLALLGENGAGKSTLIKMLGGAHLPDDGRMTIHGAPVRIANPADAQRAGIAMIYQEFNLVPALSVRENLFLGRDLNRAGFVQVGAERRQAARVFERMGVSIDPETPCRQLSVAQQQLVEIARALAMDTRIIVMDEPSAALTLQEVDVMLEIVRELRRQGIGIIYISHRLEEIFEIADRVMVLRDGEHVGTSSIGEVTRDSLIELMVGRALEDEFPRRAVEIGRERLVVEGLSRSDAVRGVSFSVCAGEILAVTGLVGAGRTEMARLIFGADRRDDGRITLDGRELRIRSPRDAIRQGIGLLTEDRKLQGLVLAHSSLNNFALPNLARFSQLGFVRSGAEGEEFADYVESLRIRLADPRFPVKNLSGGNQQKVVLAKWLARHCEAVIFDEPTRGVDVGAKLEIYTLMNRLAADGKAIVMISSELPEVMGMADRILVMHQGRVTGEITDVSKATQQQIMQLAIG